MATLATLPLLASNRATANADKAPKSLTIQLGSPPRQFDVALNADVPHAVVIHVGQHPLKLTATAPATGKKKAPELIASENFELTSGSTIALVRLVTGDAKRYVVVIGLDTRERPRVLWQGEESSHGDPGERTQKAVRSFADGTGVVLFAGTTYEQARLCGQPSLPLLESVRIDGDGAHESAPPPRDGAVEITAAVSSVAQVASPVLQLLSAQGQSNGDRGLGPTPPFSLLDGNHDSSWSAGESFGGVGQFVSLDFRAHGLPLQRLAVRFADGSGLPTALRVHTRDGVVTAALPSTLSPSQPWLVIQPAAPLTSPCLSIEIAGPAHDGAAVKLAEVVAFTEFDGADGPEALVRALSGPNATAASGILAQSGTATLPALSQAWPSLDATAKRRTLPLLLRHLEQPVARDLLGAALDDDTTDSAGPSRHSLRELTLKGVANRGAAALALVKTRLSASPPDAELALTVANSATGDLAQPILDALALIEAGPLQGQLTQAFVRVAQRDAHTLALIQPWLAQQPSPSSAARLAIALSPARPSLALVTALVSRAIAGTEADFPTRYWALQAAPLGYQAEQALQNRSTDGPQHAILTYVRRLAEQDPTWMLRENGLSVLHQMAPSVGLDVAQSALDDPYPRVRAQAIRLLGPTAPPTPRLLQHLNQDPWYLVRVAAAESLADSPQAREGLRSRISDPARDVRVAAVNRLAQLRDNAAWPAIKQRLAAKHEALDVKLAAVEYAAGLCLRDAVAPLQTFVHTGVAPGASEASSELAVSAAAALARLGQAATVTPVLERVPETGLKSAVQQALDTRAVCKP